MKVLLLIGTRKGGFVATSDVGRANWTLAGPFLKGCEEFTHALNRYPVAEQPG